MPIMAIPGTAVTGIRIAIRGTDGPHFILASVIHTTGSAIILIIITVTRFMADILTVMADMVEFRCLTPVERASDRLPISHGVQREE
jgi:hypothetical protein